MYKILNEKEFIEIASEKHYRGIVEKAFSMVKETPEFKNSKPDFYSILLFPCDIGGKKHQTIVEVSAHKIMHNTGVLNMYDFGIIGMALTDEDMPDELLDKYNTAKKLKESEA